MSVSSSHSFIFLCDDASTAHAVDTPFSGFFVANRPYRDEDQ